MTAAHELKETLSVDYNIPEHADRVATPLFIKTRKHLLERDSGRCWVCNQTAEETGHPIEAHHYPIERCFADMIDWSEGSQIRKDFPQFAWGSFDEKDPYFFVDDIDSDKVEVKNIEPEKCEGWEWTPYTKFPQSMFCDTRQQILNYFITRTL